MALVGSFQHKKDSPNNLPFNKYCTMNRKCVLAITIFSVFVAGSCFVYTGSDISFTPAYSNHIDGQNLKDLHQPMPVSQNVVQNKRTKATVKRKYKFTLFQKSFNPNAKIGSDNLKRDEEHNRGYIEEEILFGRNPKNVNGIKNKNTNIFPKSKFSKEITPNFRRSKKTYYSKYNSNTNQEKQSSGSVVAIDSVRSRSSLEPSRGSMEEYDDDDDDDDGDEEFDDPVRDNPDNGMHNDEPFIYSNAFPKQQKPAWLINWKPSQDSSLFFQPIDQNLSIGWAYSAYYVPGTGPLRPHAAADGRNAGSVKDNVANSSPGEHPTQSSYIFNDIFQDLKSKLKESGKDNSYSMNTNGNGNRKGLTLKLNGLSVGIGPGRKSYGGIQEMATVRVFGLILKDKETDLNMYCSFYDKDRQLLEQIEGRRVSLKGGHRGTLYDGSYIECPLNDQSTDDNADLRPHYLSLSCDPTILESDLDTENPVNLLEIKYPGKPKDRFAVCFSPFHSNYNATGQLVEAIEFNRLLGADHFYVYNFSIAASVEHILREYQNDGLLTIIQWPLPSLETWYYGQVVAINDCVYRNRGVSDYVVIIDTDEVIIPSKHSNWLSLIEEVNSYPSLRSSPDSLLDPDVNASFRKNGNSNGGDDDDDDEDDDDVDEDGYDGNKSNDVFGAWSFRCSFFIDKELDSKELKQLLNFNFTREEKRTLERFPSRIMLSVKRTNQFRHGKRSKTIVRPECIDIAGVHKVISVRKGCKVAFVNKRVAMLQHYRAFKSKSEHKALQLWAVAFKNQYLERIKNVLVRFPRLSL